jgi:hypothetical protein
VTASYPFDPARCVIFDVECFPGPRWMCGFLGPGPDGGLRHVVVDGDPDKLRRVLAKVRKRGLCLVGYNSRDYDLPILRAVLAGADPHALSREIVGHDGRGLPESAWERLRGWPKIRVDHLDLAARTRDMGRIVSLKVLAANLGWRRLRELPHDPEGTLTDSQWREVKGYNLNDLEVTRAVLVHFTPVLRQIAALSERFGTDLRNVHQAGIAQAVLCKAYRREHGAWPEKMDVPASIGYTQPPAVSRPRGEAAAVWFDRLTSERFPMVDGKADVPGPTSPIVIGGATLSVGKGGFTRSMAPRSTAATTIPRSSRPTSRPITR